jgi:hypothetical protein
MPVSSNPIRLDAELVEAARLAAKPMSRSVAQQISHWARLGRALEASPDISVRAIREALAGTADFDALSPKEQAVVRAQWQVRMKELEDGLRMDHELAEQGLRYAELDEAGCVVIREPARSRTKSG